MVSIQIIDNWNTIFPKSLIEEYIRVNDDESIVKMMVMASERYIERETKQIISRKNIIISTDEICDNKFKIEVSPIMCINSVMIDDTFFTSDNYVLDNGIMVLKNYTHGFLVINLDAGHNFISQISPELQNAVLWRAASLYDNRGGDYNDIDAKSDHIYGSQRKIRF